ncbi:MAG: Phosphatidylinositol-4-phosphate 5-kinase [Stictis urceolatum]|nr:Phosphatidylinositol-4-phosphate 5-kinase [Stictis urceolata]
MSAGNYTSSTSYRTVEVLLLSWDEDGDDLDVKQEVEDLAAVFKGTFNYGTTVEKLQRHQNKTAQSYINMVVANWVWKNDGPRTLLIVYFAGHGRKGEKSNELKLAGRKQPRDYRAHLDTVVWNRTEENLRDTQSDVLQIFDCCYAGTLTQPERGHSLEPRAFEYLAAAPPNKRTPGPGANSFTTALIWALKHLASKPKGRFTSGQLVDTIKEKAPGFSRTQEPFLVKRDDTGDEKIILSPLQEDASNDADSVLPTPASGPADASERTVLTLKFVFNQTPQVSDITLLGQNLNMMVTNHDFNMNRIMWGGLHSHTKDSVFAAASRFRSLLKGRTSRFDSRSLSDSPSIGESKRLHEEDAAEDRGEYDTGSPTKRLRSYPS